MNFKQVLFLILSTIGFIFVYYALFGMWVLYAAMILVQAVFQVSVLKALRN